MRFKPLLMVLCMVLGDAFFMYAAPPPLPPGYWQIVVLQERGRYSVEEHFAPGCEVNFQGTRYTHSWFIYGLWGELLSVHFFNVDLQDEVAAQGISLVANLLNSDNCRELLPLLRANAKRIGDYLEVVGVPDESYEEHNPLSGMWCCCCWLLGDRQEKRSA